MKRYLVRVEYSGFEKVWVEAEDEDEAQEIAIDRIDWATWNFLVKSAKK